MRKILTQLGAQSRVVSFEVQTTNVTSAESQLSGEQGRNPLVLATFSGTDTGKPRKRVLFYGEKPQPVQR